MASDHQCFEGMIYRRGDQGYEAAPCAALWNGRKPDRYFEVILIAASDDDVVEAVRFAHASKHKIGIRSGGYRYFGNGVRRGSHPLRALECRARGTAP